MKAALLFAGPLLILTWRDAVHRLRGTSAEAYRIRFMNRFSRGSGNFTACQRSIMICGAKSRDDAIEAATKRFTLEGIADGHLRASAPETELIKVNAEAGKRRPNNTTHIRHVCGSDWTSGGCRRD